MKLKRRVTCHLETMSLKTLNDQHNFQKKINNHGTVECLLDKLRLNLSHNILLIAIGKNKVVIA